MRVAALNPDPENLPVLDPKDQFLLLEPSATSNLYSSSVFTPSASGTSTPITMPHVSWLRKTEYLSSRDPTSRALLTSEPYVDNQCYMVLTLRVRTGSTSTSPWTSRTPHNYAILRLPSLQQITLISPRLSIPTSPKLRPKCHTRCSLMTISGRMLMTSSAFRNVLETVHQMYAFCGPT